MKSETCLVRLQPGGSLKECGQPTVIMRYFPDADEWSLLGPISMCAEHSRWFDMDRRGFMEALEIASDELIFGPYRAKRRAV